MNTFPFMLATLCIFALGYRYYSAFIAAKVVALDERRITPAYLISTKTAITEVGKPLVRPVRLEEVRPFQE